MELEGYSRPKYNKLVHSAQMHSIVIGVIQKLTNYEFLDHTNTDDLLWQNFISPQCRNYSREPDHTHLGDSQPSQGYTSHDQPVYKIWSSSLSYSVDISLGAKF